MPLKIIKIYQVLCLFNTSTRAFNTDGFISFSVRANIVFLEIAIFSESNLTAASVGISSLPKRYLKSESKQKIPNILHKLPLVN